MPTKGISPEIYEGADNLEASALGFVFGMQFSNDNGPGNCFKTLSLAFQVQNEVLTIITEILTLDAGVNLMSAGKDLVDIMASIQNYCQVEAFLNIIVGMFSGQGASQLMTRASTVFGLNGPTLLGNYNTQLEM